eukprot:GHVQ01008479.1.p1 GENE.GHVQ01008479.1~~GHVQ01008479.1.p1  ORF type:complete len:372 (+),score=33.26 GHVQ01008479.1:900-2015(+)
MLTDSGGYQIFAFGHGRVSEEIKGNRNRTNASGISLTQSVGQQNASPLHHDPRTTAFANRKHDDADSGTSSPERRFKADVSITEEGAKFRSYYDGSQKVLTPERSIQIQNQLGADIVLVLDECTPYNVPKTFPQASMERSHRWAVRSLTEFNKLNDSSQVLYGIVQGGVYDDLRKQSAGFVNSAPFFGTAIGGSLGKSKEMMNSVVENTMCWLRKDRPVHLLGIGDVEDIFNGVAKGIDTFDCVHPTRIARHGKALVTTNVRRDSVVYDKEDNKPATRATQHINLHKSSFQNDESPIDESCGCPTCKNNSRAYLHYLLRAGEFIGGSLVTLHNVFFMNRLMKAIRSAILNDSLPEERENWIHPSALAPHAR